MSARDAAHLVAVTYPDTRGDTFYRWADPDDPDRIAVGVYGLWNRLRGDRVDLGGTKVDDDARTIAQFSRLTGNDTPEIVHISGLYDAAVTTVTLQTADAIRNGDRFEPQEVASEPMIEDRAADMWRSIRSLDGAAEYLRSIPKPTFGL